MFGSAACKLIVVLNWNLDSVLSCRLVEFALKSIEYGHYEEGFVYWNS